MRFLQDPFTRIILSLLILLMLVSCSSKLPIKSELVESQIPSVKNVYAEALRLSVAWRNDAILGFAQVKPLRGNNTTYDSSVIFSFESPVNDGAYFIVTCQEDFCSGEEFVRPTDSDLINSLTLNESMLDSEDALEIAMTNGGENYVDIPSAFKLITLRLLNNNSNIPVWDVYFNDHLGLGGLHVVIDATTGEIME